MSRGQLFGEGDSFPARTEVKISGLGRLRWLEVVVVENWQKGMGLPSHKNKRDWNLDLGGKPPLILNSVGSGPLRC